MTRISSRMFTLLAVLSLTVSLAASAEAPAGEKLGNRQVKALIATAKTSADHERIAHYYEAEAQQYLAQSKQHEAMVEAYKANPALATDKSRMATMDHCEYYAKTLKDRADKAEKLAQSHEQMAQAASGTKAVSQ